MIAVRERVCFSSSAGAVESHSLSRMIPKPNCLLSGLVFFFYLFGFFNEKEVQKLGHSNSLNRLTKDV